MAAGPRVVVTAVGVCSPLGRSARLYALGMRAGAASTQPLQVAPRSVRAAPAVAVEPSATLAERLSALIAPALAEVTARVQSPVPLICALPALPGEPQPDLALDPQAVLRRARELSGASIDLARTTWLQGGSSAAGAAFARALDALGAERGLDAVLVGAADSWLIEARLRELLDKKRVRAEGDTSRSRRGSLTPGEGAAFVLLERERSARSAGRRALCSIVACELARREPKDPPGPQLAAALAKLAGAREGVWLINDVNGESRRADAWSSAVQAARDASGSLRVTARLEQVSSPARDAGDCGVATSALGVALAATLFGAGAAPEEAAIVASYDAEGISALAVERGDEPERGAQAAPAAGGALASEVAVAFRVLEASLRAFRAVEHRLHPARRNPILDATFGLGRCLAAIEDAEFPSSEQFSDVSDACGALTLACERANRSEERRGRVAEPAVKDLERLAAEIAALSKELHAAAPEPPEAATLPPIGPVPLIVAPGRPLELPIPFYAIERAPTAEPPDQDLELEDEIEEEPAPGEERSLRPERPPPPQPSGPHVATALECLDSIARLWPLRTPRSDGRWTRALHEVEARLLSQLDFLHALSAPYESRPAPALLRDEVLDLLPLVRRQESGSEPGRAFADTLVLASARDPRLVRAAVAGARGASSDLVDAYTDALALGASPHVDEALAELCLEDDPRTLELALEVSWRRRSAATGAIVPCLYHASPEVRRKAARALGASPHAAAAAKALDARLALEQSPRVVTALLEAMARLHAPHVEEHVGRLLGELVREGSELSDERLEARLELARLSAALGRAADAAALATVATRPREVECLGWFGRPGIIGWLVDGLTTRAKEEGTPQACARALCRITGLVLEGTSRGARLVDGALATVDDERLVLDAQLWRAHLAAHPELFSASSKLRFGQRFDASLAITEHLADGVRVSDRAFTSLEVALGARGVCAADEGAWVQAQLAALGRST